MPANLENSVVATGLEKVSFHSHPKEGQCQRIFKLPYSCAHFTCQQGNAQNPSSQASTVYVNQELSDVQAGCTRCTRKSRRTRGQIASIHGIIEKARQFQKSIYFTEYAKAFECVDHSKLWKIFKEMGIPDRLSCLLRNLNAVQEATDRTEHGTTVWFTVGNHHRCCILLLLI